MVGAVITIVYWPFGNRAARNRPLSSVVYSRSPPCREGELTDTRAPLTGVPSAFFTVPLILPVVSAWARASRGTSKNANTESVLFIQSPPPGSNRAYSRWTQRSPSRKATHVP